MEPLLRWLRLMAVAGLVGALGGGAAETVGLSVLLEARAASGRALGLLLTRQRADGSWAGDPRTTAQVLVSLANAPSLGGDARAAEATARGEAYLRGVVEETPMEPPAVVDSCPTEALAASLVALARLEPVRNRALLSRGRAAILSRAQRLTLADGRHGLAFATGTPAAPDLLATCAALDALLLSEGLDPAWTREGYVGVAAYLREALESTLRSAAGAPAVPAPVGTVEAVARALLSLGVPPEEPLASVLEGLARRPPDGPAPAFFAAEALSLAEVGLAGWRERLVEALLGSQQGDGGWAGLTPEEPRDRATALALRAVQVALGRHLQESAGPPEPP